MSSQKSIDIPIYLVSLKQDVARREKLKERFPETYSSFQHIEAVDGRLLPAKEYFEKTIGFYSYHKRVMTPAELGCALSHIQALTEFLNTSSSHAMIIEDDIIGKDEDFKLIADFIKAEFKGEGIAYCGCQDGLMNRYKYGKPIGNDVLKVVYSNRGEFPRAAAYIVSRKTAESILSFHNEQFITVADFWFDLLKEFKGNIYYLPVLSHPLDLGDSNIENERLSVNRNIVQKIFSRDVLLLIYRRVVKEIKRLWYKLQGHVQVKGING